jgi:hypothetical protein
MDFNLIRKTTFNRKRFATLQITLIAILFASGQAFAWTKSSNFESGSVGALAQGTSGFDYAGSATKYSSDTASSGTKSAKMTWSTGADGYAVDHGEYAFSSSVTNGGEVWARAYFYFASPWSWSCSPVVKVLRGVQVLNSGGSNVGYLSVFADSGGGILLSNEVGDVQIGTGAKFDLNAWQCIEMYVKLSPTAPIFRIWKNGVLIYEDTTHRTLSSTSDFGSRALIMTQWNGGAPQAQSQYVDDVVITTDRPSQVDSKGNPMIGPINGTSSSSSSSSSASLPPPTNLRAN